MPWRPHYVVARNRIVVRPMMVLRPFIDLFRPRLDRLCATNQSHAFGRQHPHDFLHRQLAQVVGNNQANEIVHVG